MKQHIFFLILLSALNYTGCFAQINLPAETAKSLAIRQFTIEPGIGIHTNFGKDLLLTNLVQWNPKKRLSIAAHSSIAINNPLKRKFNGITTDYNYSLNQKFGAGTTLYAKRSSHTILLMAGLKYTAYQETLVSPDDGEVSAAVSGFSPDYGLLYSLKKGVKKYFFSARLYLPLYPWPAKDFTISTADGNMNNISLELGIGIKIK